MKINKNLFLMLLVMSISTTVLARDDVGDYSIADTLGLEQAKEKLGDEVKFYFGTQPHGKILKNFGEKGTNKKTNAFGKTDEEACQWAFLSAMMSLKDRAVREGGNAIVSIKSNYKNRETTSNETFQCGAGSIIAGVALKGKIVTIGN